MFFPFLLLVLCLWYPTHGAAAPADGGPDCNGAQPFQWSVSGFSSCSSSCDAGTQTQTVSCVNPAGHVMDDSKCNCVAKPATSQACNTNNPCFHFVNSGLLSSCSQVCQGSQSELFSCQDKAGNVDPTKCQGQTPPKPATTPCGQCGADVFEGSFLCTVASAGNTCDLHCAAGFGDCDKQSSTGCEMDITSSVGNCGGCGNQCSFANAAASCVSSTCTLGECKQGFANCDSIASTGCEVDLNNDSQNCGACGNACSSPHVCKGGQCVLSPIGCYADCLSTYQSNAGRCERVMNDNNGPENLGVFGGAAATVESCYQYALAHGFAYAGIEYASECFVSNTMPTVLASSVGLSCNFDRIYGCPRGRPNEPCGGSYALSVYAVTG